LWSPNPIGKAENGNTESGFEGKFPNDVSQQKSVGFAIGQDWVLMDPFKKGGIQESSFANLSDEDKKWAKLFYEATAEFDAAEAQAAQESGLLGTPASRQSLMDRLRTWKYGSISFIARQSWSSKYCKSLGYMRSADKSGFTRCMAATKINFVAAKKGKWTYPAAPEGKEADLSPEQLAAMSAKDIASMSDDEKNELLRKEAEKEAAENAGAPPAAKSKMMMYAIIGFVILAIIIAIIIMMRKKAALSGAT
jgi:hypothetical protein